MNAEMPIIDGSNARVCIIARSIPPIFGGSGLRAYRYACRLHKDGRLAFIITERPAKDAGSEEHLYAKGSVPQEKVFGVPDRRFRKRYYAQEMAQYRVAFLFQALYRWWSVLHLLLKKRREYDVVYGFGAAAQLSLYAVLSARLLGKKAVLSTTLLGIDDPLTIQKDPHRLRRWFRTRAFSAANGYVSISSPITETCRKAGIPTHRVWEISNPVDVHLFSPCSEEERRVLRKKLGIPDETFALVFVGGISWRKGVDLLIDAFAQLCRTCDSTQLLMIGPRLAGKESEKCFLDRLDKRISLLGLSKKLRFVGFTSNVHLYMKACDVFVFPSRAEGCANVLVEAMASGLPTVTCHIAGLAQYIFTNEVDGLIVDYTPEAIAEAVERLRCDPDFRKGIAANAVRTARSRFATEIVDSHYDRVYMAVLKSGECPKPCNGEMNCA